jgi:hypothetical protein
MTNKNFAELNDENRVTRVIIAESKEWCESILGGTWIETFDNGIDDPRADVGDTYDFSSNKFIKPIFESEEEPAVEEITTEEITTEEEAEV